MTQSGALNKKIKIYNKEWTKNDEGFQTWNLKLVANPWTKVTNITEPIEVNGQKEGVAQERVTFEIYYREGISKGMTIEFRKNMYQITAIFNPGFNNEMLILTGTRGDSLKASEI